MKLTSISALDYVGMRATLPLANGVTTLTGENAAGKTMLTSTVPGILFGEAKLVSGAKLGLTWEGASGPGSMFVSRQGAKTTYRGTINGEAQEHHTIKPAVRWMREHLPVTQAVFSNANYLAAFRSATMLAGQPAARLQLLSDIVGLRVFDDLRAGIGKLASSANVTVALRDRLLHEITSLASEGVTDASFAVLDLGGVTNYLSTRRSDIKSEALTLSRALEDRPFGNVSTVKLEKLLNLAPARNKAWDAWDECEALDVYDIKKPSKADYRIALLIRDIEGMGITPILMGKVKPIYDKAKQEKTLASHLATVDAISKQLKHLEGHDGNTCPTCGSEIDSRVLIKGLKQARRELEAKTDKLRANVLIAKHSDYIKDEAAKINASERDLRAILVCGYDDIIENYEKAIEIEQRFGGELPSKPAKPRIDVAEVTAELKLRAKGYGTLIEGERRYDKLTAKFQGASGVLNAVSEIVEEQAEVISSHKRLRSLQAELQSLPNVEDAELYLELLKALENRNARNKYLELVAEHLIATLNDLSPAFFSYKMEFAWSNGKLIANRKGAATDVVLLSGREGRTFMLLNAVAIQLCLPPAKRLRTLFLDELEAGSSPENRTLLAELIPSLLDHYDNIVVVTPLAKSEFYIDGPRYRVVENKGVKELVREE